MSERAPAVAGPPAPAPAGQDAIDAATAGRIQARLVIEGANLPTTEAARTILSGRGLTVVPDFIANAGGIVAAAFAMDARHSGLRPDPAASPSPEYIATRHATAR